MNVSPAHGGHVNLEGGPLISYPAYKGYPGAMNFAVEAVSAPGYRFVGWGGALSGTEPITTLVLDDDKEITAKFALLLPLWLIIVLAVMAAIAVVMVVRRRRREKNEPPTRSSPPAVP